MRAVRTSAAVQRTWWGVAVAGALVVLGGCKGETVKAPAPEGQVAATERPTPPVQKPAEVIELAPDDPAVGEAGEPATAIPDPAMAAADPMGAVAETPWTPQREAEYATELAQVDLRFGKREAAVERLEAVVDKAAGTPAERQVREALSQAYQGAGQSADAVAQLEKAVAATEDPLSKKALEQQLADRYEDAGQLDEAIAAWTARFEGSTELWEREDALRRIVTLHGKAGSLEGLQKSLQDKVTADPKDVRSLQLLYQIARRPDAGEEEHKQLPDLAQALSKLRPDDLELKRQLRESLRQMGRLDEALVVARELAKDAPVGPDQTQHLDDRRQVAEILAQQGDTAGAIATLEDLLQAEGAGAWQRRDAMGRLFAVHQQQGTQDAALKKLEKTLRAKKDRHSMELLAAAYSANGKTAELVETMKRLVELAPDDLDVRQRLVSAWSTAGAWDEATGFLEGRLRAAPEDQKSMLLQELANLCAQAGQKDKARQYYQELILRDPTSRSMYQGQLDMLDAAPDTLAVDPAAGPAGTPPPAGIPPAAP